MTFNVDVAEIEAEIVVDDEREIVDEGETNTRPRSSQAKADPYSSESTGKVTL